MTAKEINDFALTLKSVRELIESGLSENLALYPRRFDELCGNIEASPRKLSYVLQKGEKRDIVAKSYAPHKYAGRAPVCWQAMPKLRDIEILDKIPGMQTLQSKTNCLLLAYFSGQSEPRTLKDAAKDLGINVRTAQMSAVALGAMLTSMGERKIIRESERYAISQAGRDVLRMVESRKNLEVSAG